MKHLGGNHSPPINIFCFSWASLSLVVFTFFFPTTCSNRLIINMIVFSYSTLFYFQWVQRVCWPLKTTSIFIFNFGNHTKRFLLIMFLHRLHYKYIRSLEETGQHNMKYSALFDSFFWLDFFSRFFHYLNSVHSIEF